jgi:hypothetical protein
MDVIADARMWAEPPFAAADLGDRRRTRRLVEAAAPIAAHPEKSFPQVFDWNGLRGFYRLCDQPQATAEAVLRPHGERTRQDRGRPALVLILHDATELDFSRRPHLRGVGPIGNENGKGFLQHNSLAVLPQPRQALGLAYQQLKVRQPAPEGESTYQRKRRPRESELWREGIRASGRPPEGCCWVDVCDRGGDDYEAMRAARERGRDFLFRAHQNRLAFVTPEHDRREYLLDYARSLPSRGDDVVEVAGRGGRPSRTAAVRRAGAAVWTPAPQGTPRQRSQPRIAAWVIRVWEPHPPPGGEEPLEWLLIGSVPASTPEQRRQRRDWYCRRWMVEVYHDIETNGGSQEDRRFETAERMATRLAAPSAAAVRVFQRRCALEAQPEAPAEQAGPATEIRVIRRFLKHGKGRFTVREFVRGVAKRGGFLGRRGDGEPGARAL